jgi:6-phosphofructokinase 2
MTNMHPVLTITLNPALDKGYPVERLVPDNKLRTPNPKVDPGGGGINVARGLQRLGVQATAMYLAGGRNGSQLTDILDHEGIHSHVVGIGAETRENITLMETSSGKQYRIVPEGPTVDPSVADEVLRQIIAIRPVPAFIVASGSLPHGFPVDFFARLARTVREMGTRCIVDTSGAPLQLAAREGLYLIKPNLKELGELAGEEHLELDQVEEAAQRIIAEGKCEVVVVSMGASGAIMATRQGVHQVPAPTVRKMSTVGAGDSMVAGMVWALEQGLPEREVLCAGVAAGTAATMNPGTELFRKDDLLRLLQWTKGRKS